jgi:endonuclease YncB( thermonuclease family)
MSGLTKLALLVAVTGLVSGLYVADLLPGLSSSSTTDYARQWTVRGKAVLVKSRFSLCGDKERTAGCVVDGDTVFIGSGDAQRRIRLTGFDTPELSGACPAEEAKAREARAALLKWIRKGPFLWDGGDAETDQGPPYDRYGRELRAAWRDNADGTRDWLAGHMLNRGLASASGWGADAVDWCA